MSSSISKSRRQVLLMTGILAGLFVPGVSRGQMAPVFPGFGMGSSPTPLPGASAPAALPYRTIKGQKPFQKAVVELFEWNCPYCRQVNDGAVQWGHSLPRGWVFVQAPIVTSEESLRAAGLYAAIQQVAGKKLSAFDDAMFTLVQDHGADPNDPRTMISAAQQSGVDYRAFQKENTAESVRQTLSEWMDLMRAAQPRVTPTFVVGGRFVTDVTMTAGRYDLLFQLLGGLVSQEVARG